MNKKGQKQKYTGMFDQSAMDKNSACKLPESLQSTTPDKECGSFFVFFLKMHCDADVYDSAFVICKSQNEFF